jgi:hypothetical protein
MEVNIQLGALVPLSPYKEPPTRTEQDSLWDLQPVWTLRKKEKSASLLPRPAFVHIYLNHSIKTGGRNFEVKYIYT